MTKFEEELYNKVKVTNIELTTEAEYKKSTLINHFKDWHSDEEFQELKEQNENQAESILLMLEEISTLKSQIQKQALPIVKDFVAEWYEENKKDLDFAIFDFCVELDELDKTSTKFEDWFDNSLNHPIETLIRMKDGYIIEKPQLFLLKHIDMSNSDKNYDKYLFKDVYGRLQHDTYAKGKKPTDHTCKFTQQEIDSMQTGSYEQIEVTE